MGRVFALLPRPHRGAFATVKKKKKKKKKKEDKPDKCPGGCERLELIERLFVLMIGYQKHV